MKKFNFYRDLGWVYLVFDLVDLKTKFSFLTHNSPFYLCRYLKSELAFELLFISPRNCKGLSINDLHRNGGRGDLAKVVTLC